MPTRAALDFIGTGVLAILVIRTLPFAVYALLSKRVMLTLKVTSALGWALLAGRLVSLGPGLCEQLLDVVKGFAYFTAAGFGCHALRHCVQRERFGRVSVLLAVAILFQLVPAVLIRGPGAPTVHVIGWELMLAAYSYCVDRSTEREPSIRDALFFLLVNPVLVFADRGRDLQRTQLDPAALRHVALGLLAIVGQSALYVLADHPFFAEHTDLLAVDSVRDYLGWVLFCGLHFFAVYWGMSGVANLQSGLMRCAGFEIAVRFRAPFLARNPGEFWERWNTYVADWFRRYVFFALASRKHWLPRNAYGRYTLITTATFVTIGLAHEYAILIGHGQARGAPTLTFLLASGVVTGWLALSRALQGVRERLALRLHWIPYLLSLGARAAFLQLAIVMTWLAIPALSGKGFPESITTLVQKRTSGAGVLGLAQPDSAMHGRRQHFAELQRHHTCALLSTGKVRCWGFGAFSRTGETGHFGQLGYGNLNSIGDDELPSSAGDVNVGGQVVQIAAGDHHTCALLSTGKVRCWGSGGLRQLGYFGTADIGDDELPSSAGDVPLTP